MDEALLPTFITIGVAVATYVIYRWAIRGSARTRTSARERLLERNPSLDLAGVRWGVAARRIRIGWVTNLAVAVAVWIAAARLVTRTTSAG